MNVYDMGKRLLVPRYDNLGRNDFNFGLRVQIPLTTLSTIVVIGTTQIEVVPLNISISRHRQWLPSIAHVFPYIIYVH